VSQQTPDEQLIMAARAIREASVPVIRRSQELCEQTKRLLAILMLSAHVPRRE